MTDPRLPDTSPTLRCPPIPADFVGVRIAVSIESHARPRFIVSGRYQIPESDARNIATPLQRALVAVVMLGDLWRVGTPFRDVVLFSDDEEQVRAGRRGCFSFDAFDGLIEVPRGTYFVFVSLGTFLSNTEQAVIP